MRLRFASFRDSVNRSVFLSTMEDSQTGLAEPQISASESFHSTEEKHKEWFTVWTSKEKREASLWRNPHFPYFFKGGPFSDARQMGRADRRSLNQSVNGVTLTVVGVLEFQYSECKATSLPVENVPWMLSPNSVLDWIRVWAWASRTSHICPTAALNIVPPLEREGSAFIKSLSSQIQLWLFSPENIIISSTLCDDYSTEEIEMEGHCQWHLTVRIIRERHLADARSGKKPFAGGIGWKV